MNSSINGATVASTPAATVVNTPASVPSVDTTSPPTPIAPLVQGPQYTSLDGQTTPKQDRIERPGFFDRAKARTAEAKQVAGLYAQVAGAKIQEKVVEPVSRVHAVSSRDMAEAVHERTERVAAEISGFTAGSTRAIGGFAAGVVSGLGAGTVNGLMAKNVKALRARDYAPKQLRKIGRWVKTEVQAGEAALFMDLYDLIVAGDAAFVQYATTSLNRSTTETIEFGGVDVECVCIPLYRDNRVIGLIIALQDASHSVYSFVQP